MQPAKTKTSGPVADGPLTQKWHDFALANIPASASDVQYQEMRRAFFGGAVAVWGLTVTDIPSETEGAVNVLHSVHVELGEIVAGVRKDNAIAARRARKKRRK